MGYLLNQNQPCGLRDARVSEWLRPSPMPTSGIRGKRGFKRQTRMLLQERNMLARPQLFSGSSLFIPVLKPPLTFSQPRTLHPLPCLSCTEPLHVSLAQKSSCVVLTLESNCMASISLSITSASRILSLHLNFLIKKKKKKGR